MIKSAKDLLTKSINCGSLSEIAGMVIIADPQTYGLKKAVLMEKGSFQAAMGMFNVSLYSGVYQQIKVGSLKFEVLIVSENICIELINRSDCFVDWNDLYKCFLDDPKSFIGIPLGTGLREYDKYLNNIK